MKLQQLDFSKAIQKAKFKNPLITYMGSKELVEIIDPILKKRISETKYDRVVIAEQFLRHFFKKKKLDEDITPLEAFQTFKIENTLDNLGNSCVALSIDCINHLPTKIKAYNTAAILSNVYQQYAGPIYCHVTPMIKFENPKNKSDKGHIILDPSFHINLPILVKENSKPFLFDMKDAKKGLWHFFKNENFIHCQPKERANEEIWDEIRLKNNLMIYRTDEILNPIESSSNPMFIIDRSYPIVSRYKDGSQRAHININLDKRIILWKIGKEKKDPITFDQILNGYKFDNNLSDLLLLDNDQLNNSIFNVVSNINILDDLYFSYLEYLKTDEEYRNLLKDPNID